MNCLNIPKGYSKEYCSPELFKYFNISKIENPMINPIQSEIYSLGIFMLKIMGYFKFNTNSLSFDDFKRDYEAHKSIIDSIDFFVGTDANELEKNIIKVIKMCLNYDPLKRLSVEELLNILENLNSKTLIEIQKDYELFQQMRKNNVQSEKLKKV